MASKKKKKKIRLVSTEGTGVFYVTNKGDKATEKIKKKKYDWKIRKHVMFEEAKMK